MMDRTPEPTRTLGKPSFESRASNMSPTVAEYERGCGMVAMSFNPAEIIPYGKDCRRLSGHFYGDGNNLLGACDAHRQRDFTDGALFKDCGRLNASEGWVI